MPKVIDGADGAYYLVGCLSGDSLDLLATGDLEPGSVDAVGCCARVATLAEHDDESIEYSFLPCEVMPPPNVTEDNWEVVSEFQIDAESPIVLVNSLLEHQIGITSRVGRFGLRLRMRSRSPAELDDDVPGEVHMLEVWPSDPTEGDDPWVAAE